MSGLLPSRPGYVKTETPGRLYVGSLKDAFDEDFLISKQISLVVTTIHPYGEWPEDQRVLYRRLGLRHFHHALYDIPQQTLDFHRLNLPDVHEYLRRGHHVLVHCEKGISRSVTLCLAYLIVYEGYNAHEALDVVRRYRPIAYPNKGFWHQLNQLCELYSYNKPEKIRVMPNAYDDSNRAGRFAKRGTRLPSSNSSSRPKSVAPCARGDYDSRYSQDMHYGRRMRSFGGDSFEEAAMYRSGNGGHKRAIVV